MYLKPPPILNYYHCYNKLNKNNQNTLALVNLKQVYNNPQFSFNKTNMRKFTLTLLLELKAGSSYLFLCIKNNILSVPTIKGQEG